MTTRGDGIAHPGIITKALVSSTGQSKPFWSSYSKYKDIMDNAARICEMYGLLNDVIQFYVTIPTNCAYIDLAVPIYFWGPYSDRWRNKTLDCYVDWGTGEPEQHVTSDTFLRHERARKNYNQWPRPRDYIISIRSKGMQWNQFDYPSFYTYGDEIKDLMNLDVTCTKICIPPGHRSPIRVIKRGFFNFIKLKEVSGNVLGYVNPGVETSVDDRWNSDANDIASMFERCCELETVPTDFFDAFRGLPVNCTKIFAGCTKLKTAPRLWEIFPDAPHEHCYQGCDNFPDVPDDWK